MFFMGVGGGGGGMDIKSVLLISLDFDSYL